MPSEDVSASRRRSSCLSSLGCAAKAVGYGRQLRVQLLQQVRLDCGGRLRCALLLDALRLFRAAPDFTACCNCDRRSYAAVASAACDPSTTPSRASCSAYASTDARRLLDPLVHHGLRVRRLVGLVVAVAPVAHGRSPRRRGICRGTSSRAIRPPGTPRHRQHSRARSGHRSPSPDRSNSRWTVPRAGRW